MKKASVSILIFLSIFLGAFSFSCANLSELEEAIKNSDIKNVLIELNLSTSMQPGLQFVDGDKVKIVENDKITYIEKCDDKYYRYYNSAEKWKKEDFTDFISKFSTAVFSYADYLFDFEARDFVKNNGGYSMTEEARQAYCERIFVKQWESLGAKVHFAEVELLILKISSGRISEFEIKYSLILDALPIQTNIIKLLLSEYGNVKVELPKID